MPRNDEWNRSYRRFRGQLYFLLFPFVPFCFIFSTQECGTAHAQDLVLLDFNILNQLRVSSWWIKPLEWYWSFLLVSWFFIMVIIIQALLEFFYSAKNLLDQYDDCSSDCSGWFAENLEEISSCKNRYYWLLFFVSNYFIYAPLLERWFI